MHPLRYAYIKICYTNHSQNTICLGIFLSNRKRSFFQKFISFYFVCSCVSVVFCQLERSMKTQEKNANLSVLDGIFFIKDHRFYLATSIEAVNFYSVSPVFVSFKYKKLRFCGFVGFET